MWKPFSKSCYPQASLMKLYRFAIIFEEYYHNFTLSFPFCGMISKKEHFCLHFKCVWVRFRFMIVFGLESSVVSFNSVANFQPLCDLTNALTLIHHDESIRDHRMCQHQQNGWRYALVIHFYGFTCVLIKLRVRLCSRRDFHFLSACVSSYWIRNKISLHFGQMPKLKEYELLSLIY